MRHLAKPQACMDFHPAEEVLMIYIVVVISSIICYIYSSSIIIEIIYTLITIKNN